MPRGRRALHPRRPPFPNRIPTSRRGPSTGTAPAYIPTAIRKSVTSGDGHAYHSFRRCGGGCRISSRRWRGASPELSMVPEDGPRAGQLHVLNLWAVSGECVRHRILLPAELRASRLLRALRASAGTTHLWSAILIAYRSTRRSHRSQGARHVTPRDTCRAAPRMKCDRHFGVGELCA